MYCACFHGCRWLVAAGRSPSALLSQLRPLWGGSGLPSAAAAAVTAAAALASGGSLSEGQIGELMGDLLGLVGPNSRSSVVSSAALTALSRLLPTLHPADWANREAIVNALHNTLLDCSSSSSSSSMLAAAAAEAAGFVGVTLLQQHADGGNPLGALGFRGEGGGDRGLALGCSCLGLLLSCFSATFSSSSSSSSSSAAAVVAAVLAKLPGSCRDLVLVQELRFSEDVLQNPAFATAAVKGCCSVLAALQKRLAGGPAAAVVRQGAGVDGGAAAAAAGVFAEFVLKVLSSSSSSSNTSGSGDTVAAAAAAAGAVSLAIGAGGNAQQQLAAVAADLRRLATGSSNAAGDTRATPTAAAAAAAAVSWAQVVALQLQLARCSNDTTDVQQVGARLACWNDVDP